MKERPILFSAPMVQAILDGSKTQTRRVMKLQPTAQPTLCHNVTNNGQPSWVSDLYIQGARMGSQLQTCPYGQPGDRLWVRETWAASEFFSQDKGETIRTISYRATSKNTDFKGWKPSIHMRRSDSRITLEVTSIRIERLNEISSLDALDEGTPDLRTVENNWDMKRCFQELWEQINGVGSWKENPYVWVIGFQRC